MKAENVPEPSTLGDMKIGGRGRRGGVRPTTRRRRMRTDDDDDTEEVS